MADEALHRMAVERAAQRPPQRRRPMPVEPRRDLVEESPVAVSRREILPDLRRRGVVQHCRGRQLEPAVARGNDRRVVPADARERREARAQLPIKGRLERVRHDDVRERLQLDRGARQGIAQATGAHVRPSLIGGIEPRRVTRHKARVIP